MPENAGWTVMFVLFGGQLTISTSLYLGEKIVKRRIVWRRTGFVEYRKEGTRRSLTLVCVVAVVISTGMVFALFRGVACTAPLLGLLFAGIYAFTIARRIRGKWPVVPLMLLGSLAAPFAPNLLGRRPFVDVMSQMWWCMLWFGILYLASGMITFSHYLRKTRIAQ